MFRRRYFPVDIILLCVRWHYECKLSFRDSTEMTQERKYNADPFTVMRWGHCYAA